MSRRISTKKRFPERESKYDNLLVSLLINRILKSGKIYLIIKKTFFEPQYYQIAIEIIN